MIRYINSKICLFVAWVASKLDNKYLRDCVDDFYRNNDCKFHWQWIRMPKVKQVYADKLIDNLTETKPMDTPTGLIWNLEFKLGSDD